MFHSRRKILEISSQKSSNASVQLKRLLFLDRLKDLGYHHSTLAGLTVGIADIPVVEDKAEIIEESHKRVEQITKQFRRGLITDDERYNAVTAEWRAARKLKNV